ncbi:hypothetical protein FRC01_005658 [Tulasnella sp. 417]|nr:hypothetical protein FRC01_005658 [Tulasnella sp. 417]
MAFDYRIDGTTFLWSFIDSSAPLRIVDVALERSGTSLLSIRFRTNSFNTAFSFMEKVVPHIGRWKVADLSDPAWQYLPQTPAPRLEELSVSPWHSHDLYPASEPKILRGEFTSLQSLTLDRLRLARPLPNFGRNLRFLAVRQLSLMDSGVTYTEIHQLLLLHPSLIEVELQASQWSNPSATETLEDVDLPHLHRFSLLDPRSNGLASIPLLQKISAPSCTFFNLSIRHYTEGLLKLLQALEPFFATVVTTAAKNLQLSITSNPEFVLEIGRDESRFKLSTWGPCQGLELDWVADMLARYRSNITHLKLLTPRTPSYGTLSNLFTNLTAVTEFYVEESVIFEVWRVLGRPASTTVEGGPAPWLLPALEKLVIFDPVVIDCAHVISAIEAREAAATEIHMEHHPTRLKTVEYQGRPWVGVDRRWSELLGDRFVFKVLTNY